MLADRELGSARRVALGEAGLQDFLVVVDETPECLKALRFAARRAKSTGRGVAMLFVIAPDDFQHWRMVADAMRAEAWRAAEARLAALSDEVKALTGVSPRMAIKEGPKRDTVIEYMREDANIAVLVLGAGADGPSPGPLVASLAGQLSGTLPIPVTIVPGAMTLEQIDAVC